MGTFTSGRRPGSTVTIWSRWIIPIYTMIRDAWMKASNAWAQVEAEKLAAAIKAEKEAKKAARMAAAAAKKAAAEAEVASE